MKKTGKILLLGISLILIGIIIFISVLAANNWDYYKLGKRVYVSKEYIFEETVENFDFDIENANIEFHTSETNEFKIICIEKEGLEHDIKIINNTLVIESNKHKTLMDYMQIDVDRPQIKIYLPFTDLNSINIDAGIGFVSIGDDFKLNKIEIDVTTGNIRFGAYCSGLVKLSSSTGKIFVWGNGIDSDVEVYTTTGHVFIDDIEIKGDIDVEVSTGKVSIENVICSNLNISGTTGNIKLIDVNVLENTVVKSTTGHVYFTNFYASGINVNTNTGNVKGTIKSPFDYEANSNTGKVSVPIDQGTNKCIINTVTGDIIISTN